MGKVVATIAVLAVAVAVAAYAPALSAALVHAGLSATLAAAITATASIVAVAGANALAGAIVSAPGMSRSGVRARYQRNNPTTLKLEWEEPSPPSPLPLQPIGPAGWRNPVFYPRQSVAIVSCRGFCLWPQLPWLCWLVVDRRAVIEPGDLFVFNVDDLHSAYLHHAWWNPLGWLARFAPGMTKRYLGVDEEVDAIVYELNNPPTVCHSGRGRFKFAYRVAGWSRTPWGAWLMARRLAAAI